jgi:hypothetical protein
MQNEHSMGDAKGKFKAQEVAYRDPGRSWKRVVCRSERQLGRLLERCNERCAEVLTRDAV